MADCDFPISFIVMLRTIFLVSVLLIGKIAFAQQKPIEKPTIVGNYESHPPTKSEKSKYKSEGYTSYAGGLELQLLADSSFSYSTCGHLVNGRWSFDLVTLFLDTKSVEKKINKTESISIELDSASFYKNGMLFEIEDGYLINRDNSRISKLYKVN